MSDGGSGNSLQAGHLGRARGCRVSSRWGREPSGLIKGSILYKRRLFSVDIKNTLVEVVKNKHIIVFYVSN